MQKMKLHQNKFNEIKEMLISKLGEKIIIDEENEPEMEEILTAN